MSKYKYRWDPKLKHLLSNGDRTMKRKYWDPYQKAQICRRYIDGVEGRKPHIGTVRLSNQLGIGRLTLKRWVAQYKSGGIEELKNRSHRGKRKVTLKDMSPEWGKIKLNPREVAMVRYGMPGLSNAQIGALLGHTTKYIYQVRLGLAGGPLAAPVPTPEYRTQEEAHQWFIHKALRVIEAYNKALAEIEANKDNPKIDRILEEADDEGGRKRAEIGAGDPKRRAAERRHAARKRALAAQSGNPSPDSPADGQREVPPPSQGQPPGHQRPSGPGTATAGLHPGGDGFIVRKRR